MRKKSNFASLKKLFSYLKHNKPLLILSLIMTAGIVFFTLMLPLLFGEAVDAIVGKDQVKFGDLISVLIRAAVFIGVCACLQWFVNICNNKLTYGIILGLRNDAFSKIQSLPISYLDNRQSGSVVSLIISDTEQVTDGLLLGFTQFFQSLLIIGGTIGLMAALQWQIALLVVFLTPLSLFIAAFIAKKSYNLFKKQASSREDQVRLVDELVGQHKTVAAFSHEDESIEAFRVINEKLVTDSRKATFVSSLTNPSTRFVNNLVYAGVALVGGLLCISTKGTTNSFSVGQLSAFLSYATQYTKPFNEISGVITEMQNALACAQRVFELIGTPSEPCDPEDAVTLTPKDTDGSVEFSDVSFSYSKSSKLIEDFNLSVKPGQKIAIVGPTGCGKTTIINLLMRFYDIDSGTIRVCGIPQNKLTRKSLRSSFGMVLQETWLKSGTIRENLTVGKPDATDEEIREAAKLTHSHTFIMQMKDGYDTVIGEGGGSLSEGQKQLLCITQVLISKPTMLILDEATSSIDTRTEQIVQDALTKLMTGRTSFVIAHRLSTIKNADLIVVMNHGKIMETGTHAELISRNGFYAKLYNSQFESAVSS